MTAPPHRMRRRRVVITCLALASLAGPAGSDARLMPPRLSPHSIPIYATVSGTQITKWKEPRHYTYKNSYNLWWHEGGGKETVSFRTAQPQKGIVYQFAAGQTPAFGFGGFELSRIPVPALLATGSVSRTGFYATGAEPGPAGGGYPTKTTGGDCGTIQRRYQVSVEPAPRDRIVLAVSDDRTGLPKGTPNPLSGLDSCPIVVGAPEVRSGSFTDIAQRLPVSRLMAGKPTVVRAHEAYVYSKKLGFGGHVEATTDISWTLTLRPVRHRR